MSKEWTGGHVGRRSDRDKGWENPTRQDDDEATVGNAPEDRANRGNIGSNVPDFEHRK